MARSTLSELSNLWEQRDVSDEEYVAALLERIEELEKRVEELEQVEGAHASCGDWPRERTLRAEKRVGELEREKAEWTDLGVLERQQDQMDIRMLKAACVEHQRMLKAAEAKLARCVEALGEIRGRSLAAKTHEVGPLEAKGRLTRILELACARSRGRGGE